VVKIYPLSNSSLSFPLLKDFHLVHSIILLALRFLAGWPEEKRQGIFPFHPSWFYLLGNNYLRLISMAPWEWSSQLRSIPNTGELRLLINFSASKIGAERIRSLVEPWRIILW